jgi:hypothetical protein
MNTNINWAISDWTSNMAGQCANKAVWVMGVCAAVAMAAWMLASLTAGRHTQFVAFPAGNPRTTSEQ